LLLRGRRIIKQQLKRSDSGLFDSARRLVLRSSGMREVKPISSRTAG